MDAWDLPLAHVHPVVAATDDIDGYGHVNNAVYVRWLDHCAWSHSSALGLPAGDCIRDRCGMAVWRTQVNYLAPALEGDRIHVGTWIVHADGRLRVSRRFQMIRPADGRTLLRALVHYVCIDLETGKPRRMPAAFARYRPLPEVAAAVSIETQPFAPGVEPRGVA